MANSLSPSRAKRYDTRWGRKDDGKNCFGVAGLLEFGAVGAACNDKYKLFSVSEAKLRRVSTRNASEKTVLSALRMGRIPIFVGRSMLV